MDGPTRNSHPGRLVFLDGFRGFVVFSMVLVNNPGDPQYALSPLAHVAWHGLAFADTIAGWFLWVIGVTTALSLSRRLSSAEPLSVLGHIVTRALALYACGLVLVAWPAVLSGQDLLSLEFVRFMGILQRIAICYFLAGAVYLVAGQQVRALAAVALLAAYWLVLAWIPGPAVGIDPYSMEGNRAFALDHLIVGHFGETSSHSLLTIPAATATILLGTVVGDWIRPGTATAERVQWLSLGGIALIVPALIVGLSIPINRHLWTPSYVLLTSGLAMVALAAFQRLYHWQGFRRPGGWLVAYGANPLLLFVVSEIGRIAAENKGFADASGTWHPLWTTAFTGLAGVLGPHVASTLVALVYAIALGVFAATMYRKGWILKV